MGVLVLILLLFSEVSCEPSEVLVQILYKPSNCSDIGKHGDTMHVQYLGRFSDSHEVFDSSYRRNNVPFNYVLGVGGVIEGYQIGTRDMCINERRRLIVPSKYAYGSRGTGKIPSYSTLMFDVHLVQINDTPPDYPVPLELPKDVTSEGSKSCPFPVREGDSVTIEYVGKLPDGSVFDNGTGEPVSFVVGAKQILAGIDEGIVSYCKNSLISLEIPPNKAFGEKWDGPVPQWSYVYYNVTVVKHVVRSIIEDGNPNLACEDVASSATCSANDYQIKAGDYISLYYRVLNRGYQTLGEGEMSYPVGRGLIVPGWDKILIGSCIGHHTSCWIPSSLAHRKGTSLFLALPEKGLFCELKVIDVLMRYDGGDSHSLEEFDHNLMQCHEEGCSTGRAVSKSSILI